MLLQSQNYDNVDAFNTADGSDKTDKTEKFVNPQASQIFLLVLQQSSCKVAHKVDRVGEISLSVPCITNISVCILKKGTAGIVCTRYYLIDNVPST